MMRWAWICILVLLPVLASAGKVRDERFAGDARGLLTTLSTGEQIFENSAAVCVPNDTCDLEKIIFRKEDYAILPNLKDGEDNIIQSTRILLGFKTREISDLVRYVVVQFTRGCMWNSYVNDDHIVHVEYGLVRDFLGIARIQHVFPNWVVDSDDKDPAYGADITSGNRHYFLQVPEAIPAWIPYQQGRLFGERKPLIPFGYVTDSTGPAHYSPPQKTAVNMSLEFQSCVFKTTDVPERTNGVDIDRTKAVRCFLWESKYVFDHTDLEFKHQKAISEECKRPFTTRERNVHLLQLEKAIEKDSIEK